MVPTKTCLVSIRSPYGNELLLTVEVRAHSLNEAVIRAEAIIRQQKLLPNAALSAASTVAVKMCEPELRCEIELPTAHAWLNCGGRSPREEAVKTALRKLLKNAAAKQ